MVNRIIDPNFPAKLVSLVDSSGSILDFVTSETTGGIAIPVDTEVTVVAGTITADVFSDVGGNLNPALIDSSRRVIISPSSTITTVPSGTQDVNIAVSSATLDVNVVSGSITFVPDYTYTDGEAPSPFLGVAVGISSGGKFWLLDGNTLNTQPTISEYGADVKATNWMSNSSSVPTSFTSMTSANAFSDAGGTQTFNAFDLLSVGNSAYDEDSSTWRPMMLDTQGQLITLASQNGAWTVTSTPSGTQDVNVVSGSITLSQDYAYTDGESPSPYYGISMGIQNGAKFYLVDGNTMFSSPTTPEYAMNVKSALWMVDVAGSASTFSVARSMNAAASGSINPSDALAVGLIGYDSGTLRPVNVTSSGDLIVSGVFSGTQDVNIVGSSSTLDVNIAGGSITSVPSGTQDVNLISPDFTYTNAESPSPYLGIQIGGDLESDSGTFTFMKMSYQGNQTFVYEDTDALRDYGALTGFSNAGDFSFNTGGAWTGTFAPQDIVSLNVRSMNFMVDGSAGSVTSEPTRHFRTMNSVSGGTTDASYVLATGMIGSDGGTLRPVNVTSSGDLIVSGIFSGTQDINIVGSTSTLDVNITGGSISALAAGTQDVRTILVDTSEFITISAGTASGSAAFSSLTAVRDVLIQNVSGVDANVNFGTGSVGAASTLTAFLQADTGALSLESVSFDTFSAITTSGTTTIRITGIGN